MRNALFFLMPLAAIFAAGCNEAHLTPAPDASPGCGNPQAIAPCKPLAQGTAGCTGDLGSQPVLGEDEAVDASYPPGCQIIVNDPVPDEDNQCVQLGTCTCLFDGGPYTWMCQE